MITLCTGMLNSESDASPESTMPKEAINSRMDELVRPWLDLIDELRALGIEKDLAIPQIAVMGDQSSGRIY